MEELDLSPRLRVQVVLAVTHDTICAEERQRQEREAQELGLTGAEIDIARRGRSFDRHTASIVAYACAWRHADPIWIKAARQQAMVDGSTAAELAEVEKLTTYLLDMVSLIREAS